MLDRASSSSSQDSGPQQARGDVRKPLLDTLSPATCEALNGIHGLGALARLQLGSRAIRLSPHWLPQPPRIADPCTIGLRIDGEAGELIVPEKLVDRVLADLEPGLRVAPLSDAIRPILLEYALQNALQPIETALGCRITVDAVRPGRGPAADAKLVTAHVLAELQDFGQSSCLIRLSAPQLAKLAAYLGGIAEETNRRVDLPLPVRLRWARVDLTLAELRGLKAGDIVILDQTCRQAGIAMAVIGEHLAVPVELLRSGYRLTGQPVRPAGGGVEWVLDRQPPDNSRLLDAGGNGDIPLTVFMEFGRFDLDRSVVEELRAGHQLPLARPLEAGLDIVTGGAIVGRGEVTIIGDAAGVRVTRLAK